MEQSSPEKTVLCRVSLQTLRAPPCQLSPPVLGHPVLGEVHSRHLVPLEEGAAQGGLCGVLGGYPYGSYHKQCKYVQVYTRGLEPA